MVTNLSIENLGKITDTGDAERLVGRGISPVVSERRAQTAAAENGLSLGAPGSTDGKTFSDLLRDSVDQVNQFQTQADTAIRELVAGRSKNIHETMLAIERADSSLKLMMQVRNKVLDAYKEIMRMQV